MARRSVKPLWESGAAALGAWLSLSEPAIAEAVAHMGFDYTVVDTQHGVNDYRSAAALFCALDLGDTVTLARVPVNEPSIIGRMLDAGAMGVIVPMVNCAADARAAVAACRYAPDGARSYGPTRAAIGHSDYFERANRDIAVIPMIETVEALSNLDEIVSVPGVDAVYVGPSDLCVSMGLAPGVDNADRGFREALDAVVAACVRAGVVPGIHATAAVAAKRLAQGFRMVTVSADFTAVRAQMAADLAGSRSHRNG